MYKKILGLHNMTHGKGMANDSIIFGETTLRRGPGNVQEIFRRSLEIFGSL